MLSAWMSSAVSIATTKAFSGTTYSMAPGTMAMPKASASAAPKLAPAEMPSVNGLASGLLRIVCICAPAIDRAAPTTIAIRAIGMRISHSTTRTCSGTLSGMITACATCARL